MSQSANERTKYIEIIETTIEWQLPLLHKCTYTSDYDGTQMDYVSIVTIDNSLN